AERLQHRLDRGERRWPSAAFIGGLALTLLLLSRQVAGAALQTLGWSVAALVLFGLGFALRSAAYRWSGLGVLVLAAGRLFVHDLSGLSADERIATFLATGAILLLVSFVYTRVRARGSPQSP